MLGSAQYPLVTTAASLRGPAAVLEGRSADFLMKFIYETFTGRNATPEITMRQIAVSVWKLWPPGLSSVPQPGVTPGSGGQEMSRVRKRVFGNRATAALLALAPIAGAVRKMAE